MAHPGGKASEAPEELPEAAAAAAADKPSDTPTTTLPKAPTVSPEITRFGLPMTEKLVAELLCELRREPARVSPPELEQRKRLERLGGAGVAMVSKGNLASPKKNETPGTPTDTPSASPGQTPPAAGRDESPVFESDIEASSSEADFEPDWETFTGPGTLYIYKNYICFAPLSRLKLRGITGMHTERLSSIKSIEKATSSIVIPNAMMVVTAKHRLFFSALKTRDKTHSLLSSMWKVALEMQEITGPCPIAVPPAPIPPPTTTAPTPKRQRRKRDKEDEVPAEDLKEEPEIVSFPYNLLEAVGTLMSDSVTGDSRAQAILILLGTLTFGILWLFLLLRRLGSLEARLIGGQDAKCSAYNDSGAPIGGTLPSSDAIGRQLGEIQGGIEFLRGYVQKALPLAQVIYDADQ